MAGAALPVYKYRTVRKGIHFDEAQRECKRLLRASPEKNYRIVRLDGAQANNGGPYRIMLLREVT